MKELLEEVTKQLKELYDIELIVINEKKIKCTNRRFPKGKKYNLSLFYAPDRRFFVENIINQVLSDMIPKPFLVKGYKEYIKNSKNKVLV